MNKISLNKTLFWDVDYKNLDYKKNTSFIIERVLNYGNEKDYQEIKKVYGLSKIKRVAKEINYINRKNINFWSIIFDIPLKSFKCTKKFSNKKQNLFLAR
ncbi:hypothetical protein KKA24_02405 [Patescibacteria group bacterium]|nr:hypothetical protein [Patescibacteria group bacterium]